MKKSKSIFNQKELKIFETLQRLTNNSAELEKHLDRPGKVHLAKLMLQLSAIGESELKKKVS